MALSEEQRRQLKLKVVQREINDRKKEQVKNNRWFAKITSGLWWKLFRIGAGLSAVVAVLLSFDTFLPSSSIAHLKNDEYTFERWRYPVLNYQTIVVDDNIFLVSFEQLADFDIHSFKPHQSAIFRDPKGLSFNSSSGDGIYVDRVLSVYQYFPMIQLLLLVPLAAKLYKKNNGLFLTVWGVSLIFAYPIMLYLLLVRLL